MPPEVELFGGPHDGDYRRWTEPFVTVSASGGYLRKTHDGRTFYVWRTRTQLADDVDAAIAQMARAAIPHVTHDEQQARLLRGVVRLFTDVTFRPDDDDDTQGAA